MSIYVIVEGKRTEPRLYRAWLPLLVPGLREVERIEDARGRSFFLISGEGYPNYLSRIRAAIEDIEESMGHFTHLLVCVDAEEVGHDARLAELQATITAHKCPIPFTVIVADCCVEAWLLGNRKFIRRSPHDSKLRDFLQHYDVTQFDPEAITPHPAHRTRASLCLDYVRAAFRKRRERYSKRNPGAATTRPFFEALCERARDGPLEARHLRSFSRLLELPDRVQLDDSAPG